MPGPMSLLADCTRAVPSALTRTRLGRCSGWRRRPRMPCRSRSANHRRSSNVAGDFGAASQTSGADDEDLAEPPVENGSPEDSSAAGSFRRRSSIGSTPSSVASSSIADSTHQHRGCHSGSAHPDRGVHIQGYRRVSLADISVCCVQHLARRQHLLGERFVPGRLARKSWTIAVQPAVAVAAQTKPIGVRGPISRAEIELLAGQHELDRPTPSRRAASAAMVTCGQARNPAAERTADERGDDVDGFIGDSEYRSGVPAACRPPIGSCPRQ